MDLGSIFYRYDLNFDQAIVGKRLDCDCRACGEIAAELEGILTRVQTGQITAETAKAEIKAFFHNGGQSLADFLKQAEDARLALLNSNNHKEEHR